MAAYKHHQVCQRMLWLNAMHLISLFMGVVQMAYRQRLKAVPRLRLRCWSLVGKPLAKACIQVFSGGCKHAERKVQAQGDCNTCWSGACRWQWFQAPDISVLPAMFFLCRRDQNTQPFAVFCKLLRQQERLTPAAMD